MSNARRSRITLSVVLPRKIYDEIDELVKKGVFHSKTEFIKLAIVNLLKSLNDLDIKKLRKEYAQEVNDELLKCFEKLNLFNKLLELNTIDRLEKIFSKHSNIFIAYCSKCHKVLGFYTRLSNIPEVKKSPCCGAEINVTRLTLCKKLLKWISEGLDDVITKIINFRAKIVSKLTDDELEELDNIITQIKGIYGEIRNA